MRTMTLRLTAICFAFLSFSPARAQNAAPPAPARLSARESADVRRIETYLNDLKSVQARFLQVNDSGTLRHGEIALERPGKMRVVYEPEGSDFMVADGSFVHLWDAELKQQSSVPVDTGISALLLRENIGLSGDVVLTRFVRYPSKIELDLVAKDTPEDGELTLVFEDKPLKLRQWRVLDPQGRTTGVSLENMQENVEFPSETFVFVPPNIGKTGRNVQK